MNTYICKGYVHKGDHTPVIQHTCQANSKNQAKTLFSAYVAEKRVEAPVQVIRPTPSEGARRTTELPVNSANGTVQPF